MDMLMQATLTLAGRRRMRKVIADKIRAVRPHMGGFDAATRKRILWHLRGERVPVIHAGHIRKEIAENLRYGRSPLPGVNGSGSYDTDTYSYCGLADAHSDARRDALREANVGRAMLTLIGMQ